MKSLKIVLLALVVVSVGWVSSPAVTASKAAAGSYSSGDSVVGTVNGQPIYVENVERRLDALHQGADTTKRGGFNLDELAFQVVNDLLLAQEAKAIGMDLEAPIPTELREFRERLAVTRLKREEIVSPARVSDREVRSAFEEQYRRVTLRVATTYKKEDAEALLEELRERADFATLAKARSVDPYGPKGGLVKDLPRADLQREIAAAAFAEKPGKLIGPISTSIGWAVLRVEGFDEADPKRFAQEEKGMRETLRFRRSEALEAELSKKLRKRFPVMVNQVAYEAVHPERLADGRLVARSDKKGPVARIGNRSISTERLLSALNRRWMGIHNEVAAKAAIPIVLERMIEDELLVNEALRRGYGDTPRAKHQIAAYETELLVQRYLRDVIAPEVKISGEQLRQYYEQNKNQFLQPPRIRLGQVTVASKQEAEQVAVLLRKGTDLGWLAGQRSIDGFKDRGGVRGWLTPAPGVDELNKALMTARPGEVLGPMGGDGQFTVYRVISRQEQGPYPFDRVSGNVRSALFRVRLMQAIDQTVRKLREHSDIQIDSRALSQLKIGGRLQPQEDSASPHVGH